MLTRLAMVSISVPFLISLFNLTLVFFFSDDVDQKINFREFIRVLAHFRPINKASDGKLNSRDEKLKCKVSFITSFTIL